MAPDEIPLFPTLSGYVEHYAQTTPDATAVADHGGRRLTYRELAVEVRRVRSVLIDAGIGRGDVVGSLVAPSVDHWITFLATASIGGVWLGLNPRYRLNEWRDLMAVARPTVLFAADTIGQRDYRTEVDHLVREFGIQRLSLASDPGIAAGVPDLDPDDPCLLVFTSGSTGRPKGVLLRQSGMIACGRIQAHHYGHQNSVVLNPLPINHVGCIVDVGVTSLVAGGTQILLEDFVPSVYVEALVESKATLLGGVPAMLLYLMAEPAFWNADLSSVQRILWSGGAMPRNGAELLATLGKPMHNFYGMTETTGSMTFTSPDADVAELVESVGRPDPAWHIRIADPITGKELGIGEVGEIQVRGPGILHSYLGDEQATGEAFTDDGFLKTADLAVHNDDGTLSLVGRLRDMFKSGGYNVFPRQVEEVIEAHPEVIMATVIPVPGAPLEGEGLATWMKERIASYKIPKEIVFLDTPPLLPSGKVDRTTLRAMALESQHRD